MRSRTVSGVITLILAVVFMAAGCSKKEPEAAGQVAAPAPEAIAAADATAATAESNAGATVYKAYCAACHGATGKGDGAAAAALNPKPADFSSGIFKYDANGNGVAGEVDDIKAIVHDGAAKYGGSPLMTPWPMLSADQSQAIAEYVKSLHGG
ncbi:MAG: cytochrome c [Gammaproteobacteria bacterium]|nr:cytochrome c [Gammaproteobacteria bacterium]